MSAIDKLVERCTGLRRPHEWSGAPLAVDFEGRTTGEIQPMGFATQEQFVLELRISSTYWANRAQRDDARKSAAQTIMRLLYEDALLPLSRLRQAILNGDRDEAYELCNQVESVILGKP